MQIVSVFGGIVDFRNEDNVGVLFLHLGNGPMPEVNRHHFCHVTTESVHLLSCPEQQDVKHLVPGVGNGVKVVRSSSSIVHAIVQLHGLIPVIDTGISREVVIASGTGGKLNVIL